MGSIRGEVKVAAQNLVCGLLIDTFNIIITPFDLFGEGREAGLAEGRAEGLSAGLTKGQTKTQISIIRFQFLTKRKTPELIADDLGLSLAFVQQICDLLTTHPQEPDEKLADYFLTRQSKILANR